MLYNWNFHFLLSNVLTKISICISKCLFIVVYISISLSSLIICWPRSFINNWWYLCHNLLLLSCLLILWSCCLLNILKQIIIIIIELYINTSRTETSRTYWWISKFKRRGAGNINWLGNLVFIHSYFFQQIWELSHSISIICL